MAPTLIAVGALIAVVAIAGIALSLSRPISAGIAGRDMTVVRDGLLRTVLDYGDIICQTAAPFVRA